MMSTIAGRMLSIVAYLAMAGGHPWHVSDEKENVSQVWVCNDHDKESCRKSWSWIIWLNRSFVHASMRRYRWTPSE